MPDPSPSQPPKSSGEGVLEGDLVRLGSYGSFLKPPAELAWVRPGIAVGNIGAALDSASLDSHGIRSILCLDGEWAPAVLANAGSRTVEVHPLIDGKGNDLRVFERAVDTLSRLASELSPVLVHCHAGRSRSPAVIAAYLMRTEEISAEQAISAVRLHREIYIAAGLESLIRRTV